MLLGHNDNSSCGIQQFTCDSGECIIGYRECDDLEDCTDGSDEHASCGKWVLSILLPWLPLLQYCNLIHL